MHCVLCRCDVVWQRSVSWTMHRCALAYSHSLRSCFSWSGRWCRDNFMLFIAVISLLPFFIPAPSYILQIAQAKNERWRTRSYTMRRIALTLRCVSMTLFPLFYPIACCGTMQVHEFGKKSDPFQHEPCRMLWISSFFFASLHKHSKL